VQVSEPELAEIGDAGAKAGEITGVEVDVTDAPEHPVRLEPVWQCRATGVEVSKIGRAVLPGFRAVDGEAGKFFACPRAIPVDTFEERLESRELRIELPTERSPFELRGRVPTGGGYAVSEGKRRSFLPFVDGEHGFKCS